MATVEELEARIAALEAVVQQILAANRKIEGDVFAPGVSVGTAGKARGWHRWEFHSRTEEKQPL